MNPHSSITRIVLDCLKPHQPPIHMVASSVAEIKGVQYVDIDTVEVDSETESLKLIVDGKDLDYDLIEKRLNESGVVVHSIDKVVAGSLKN